MSQAIPVLIGVGQVTVRDEPLDALSKPLDLMELSARRAAADAGVHDAVLAEIDQLAVVKSFREPTSDTPASLAARLGASDAQGWLMPDGGQSPQWPQASHLQTSQDACAQAGPKGALQAAPPHGPQDED